MNNLPPAVVEALVRWFYGWHTGFDQEDLADWFAVKPEYFS